MKNKYTIESDKANISDLTWPWWPLFPLYPYGKKHTVFREIIPNQVWSFEQLQGIYYVAVPVRMTVLKVKNGLMIFNSLPPTKQLCEKLTQLEEKFGKVIDIVLPTASGLEHKISLPALSRSFPNADLWVCPGLWSFPLNLPSSWLGISSKRTRVLFEDGLPNKDECEWESLGPINIGLGRFQEITCYHKKSKSLLVTDALVGIDENPPELFEIDPTPLLFHSRERGSDPLHDDYSLRVKGWKRLVLFASFLKPSALKIPPIKEIFQNSLKPGLRNSRAHFGFYPFKWDENWEVSSSKLIGNKSSLVQVAPVIKRLVFPRAKEEFIVWLNKISEKSDIKWLISSHYSAPIKFNRWDVNKLIKDISKSNWLLEKDDWEFLNSLDNKLLEFGVVPKDPVAKFKS